MKLNLSAIQHFSVGDSDGIRTTVFLKGCNLRCPWCHNPETITSAKVRLRYPTGELTSGSEIELDDILREVMEDTAFYADDGGVTISGGEPMLQVDAVAELVARLKMHGISVMIDTAGCVPYEHFVRLRGLVDRYLFDIKACDADSYRSLGGDHALIVGNLARLIADGERVRVRIPLIPRFNDTDECSRKICALLKNAGATEVDLLPFHRLGSAKYTAMELDYVYADEPSMSREHARKVAEIYSEFFAVRIDG